MNKISIIALVLAVSLGGFALVKADSITYPPFKQFSVSNKTVERFTDTDNGNICYVVVSSTTGGDMPISCVTDTVQMVQPVIVASPIVKK